MGLQRVRHDGSDLVHTHTHTMEYASAIGKECLDFVKTS